MSQGHPAFEPEPGTLRRAVIERSKGAITVAGGDLRYRVCAFAGGTIEFEGGRDECLDFVERAWWRAETAPTGVDRSHRETYAVGLAFERWDPSAGSWHPDKYLTNIIERMHVGG